MSRKSAAAPALAGTVGAAVVRGAGEAARRFRSAKPFPHAVIDGFLDPRLCARLESEFPAYDPGRFRNAHGQEGKAVYQDLRALGPAFRRFDDAVSDGAFLSLLQDITGIPGLRQDPHRLGGGAQENRSGMGLLPHIDFNVHPLTGWHRRVNVLLYLNRRWRRDHGGRLRLHRLSAGRPRCVKAIPPLFNRCVIFATDERSWHGVEEVRAGAGGNAGRKSVSLYFYTAEAPAKAGPRHSTIWLFPDPIRALRAGALLDDEVLGELNRAFRLRDAELADLGERAALSGNWRSPLPDGWRPGRRLGAADVQWLRRELRGRDARLRALWFPVKKRERVVAALLDRAVELAREGLGASRGK